MSYIDCFAHRYVGMLAGYPLYRPTVTIEGAGRGAADFGCATNELVLGGGSGEHPGMVVHHFDQLVASYYEDALDTKIGDRDTPPDLLELERFLRIQQKARTAALFEFCGWPIESYVHFVEQMKSPSRAQPFDKEEHGFAEDWLAFSLAEFCLAHEPDLLSDEFRLGLKEHEAALSQLTLRKMGNVIAFG